MREEEFTPKFIMLIGIPGSGKSTYIQHIKSKYSDRKFVILSTDDILELWGNKEGLNYTQSFHKFPFKKVEQEFWQQFDDAIKNGNDIIIDQTNLTKKSRAKKLSRIPNQYEKIGVVFNTNVDEVQRRLKKREHETGKHIPDNVVKQMINSFESPSRDEFDKIEVIN